MQVSNISFKQRILVVGNYPEQSKIDSIMLEASQSEGFKYARKCIYGQGKENNTIYLLGTTPKEGTEIGKGAEYINKFLLPQCFESKKTFQQIIEYCRQNPSNVGNPSRIIKAQKMLEEIAKGNFDLSELRKHCENPLKSVTNKRNFIPNSAELIERKFHLIT